MIGYKVVRYAGNGWYKSLYMGFCSGGVTYRLNHITKPKKYHESLFVYRDYKKAYHHWLGMDTNCKIFKVKYKKGKVFKEFKWQYFTDFAKEVTLLEDITNTMFDI